MTASAPVPRLARLGLLATVLLVAGLALLHTADDGVTGRRPASPTLQLAADTGQFRPGNIISDNLFFDGWAMSAGDVQGFLNMRGATCRAGEMPCLKDYRQDTWTRPADAYCNAYAGAANESAATIIARVGQACGVSQRVLLVITQKEEGLVNGSGSTLSATRYRSAMGYGCPDTAPCDAQYYGFYNQVYKAAWQYKVYAANPKKYGRWAGATINVQWSPDASCGSAPVYLENQATAGLYDYTPYQPNAAALAAGYGSAPPCGAYGNRNFWLYYTDWFGSTQSAGGNAVVARAIAPGASSVLGSPAGNVICGLTGGGCYQAFQNGAVYWSPTTGAQIVKGLIRQHWAALGWETGRLGYPTGEEVCGLAGGGCYQNYQNGMIYWAPAPGAWSVGGAIKDAWSATGWENGPLGYPTSDENCGLTGGGCYELFQKGAVYWSPASGAQPLVAGPMTDRWSAQGWENGPLGYPTSGTLCGLTAGGCYQVFQGGSIYWSGATGAQIVKGAVRDLWGSLGWETGQLGYPTGEEVCGLVDGGCYTFFQKGIVYSSPSTGVKAVANGAIMDTWRAQGLERGPLGYPTGDLVCGLTDNGCLQAFQGGTLITSSSAGTRQVTEPVRTAWLRWNAQSGALGLPTSDQTCGLVLGGCVQHFQGGSIYDSSQTGAQVVRGAIRDAWMAQVAEQSSLGYPTTDEICTLTRSGCFQGFQGGTMYFSPATGAHPVSGAIQSAWAAQGWENGTLGYPTGEQVCGLTGGGCAQLFEHGWIFWSPGTGAHPVWGAISDAWASASAERGTLGYPTTGEMCGLTRAGCFQGFQGGWVYFSPATGAHRLSGPIQSAWAAQGWENGQLGYPSGDPVPSGSSTIQQFQGGRLVLDTRTGTVTRG